MGKLRGEFGWSAGPMDDYLTLLAGLVNGAEDVWVEQLIATVL